MMGIQLQQARYAFQYGNMRQGLRHVKQATKTGVVGATYSTIPLANGLVHGIKNSRTAMKYRVKQWSGSRNTYVNGNPNLAYQKADHVVNTTPGVQQSQTFLRKMWSRPVPQARATSGSRSGPGAGPNPIVPQASLVGTPPMGISMG